MSFAPILLLAASFLLTVPASAQPLTKDCTQTLPNPVIPSDALHPVEIIQPEYQPHSKITSLGFDHAVATINVVVTHPCYRGQGSMVEIKWLKLIRYDPGTGMRYVEQTITANGGTNTLVGETWYRQPIWFRSGKPNPQPYLTWLNNGNFAVSVQSAPLGIYHWWSHPRLRIQAGYPYMVEAEIRVTGDTRVQFGIDYWRGAQTAYNDYSPGCVNSNNCEAFQGHWIGPTNGQFVVVTGPTTRYLP